MISSMTSSVAKLFRWDRSDYLATQIFLVLAVLAALTPVGIHLGRWIAGDSLLAKIDTGGSDAALPGDLASTKSGVTAYWDGVINLAISDPTAGQRIAGLIPAALVAILVGIVAWSLLRLVRAASNDKPFGPAAVAALRFIAYTIAIGAVAIPLAQAFCAGSLASSALSALDGSYSTAAEFKFAWLGLSLLLLLLAEIFRRGSELADDVEGLV